MYNTPDGNGCKFWCSGAGPAGEALKLARMKELRWIPRQEYSRLRYRHLKGLANPASWQKAIELHAEMNSKGLELPASEMLEFIEAWLLCPPAPHLNLHAHKIVNSLM